jgi:hypothetical protein
VHTSQYEEMYNLMLERTRSLRVGAALAADGVGTGVDMGSMISQAPFQRLEDTINKARSMGARVEQGGARLRHPYLENGAFFAPTVMGDVTPEMDVANDECMCISGTKRAIFDVLYKYLHLLRSSYLMRPSKKPSTSPTELDMLLVPAFSVRISINALMLRNIWNAVWSPSMTSGSFM